MEGWGSFSNHTSYGHGEGELHHSIDIETKSDYTILHLGASVSGYADIVEGAPVTIGSDTGGYRANADGTATAVFQIAPEGGEQWGDPVEVHISAGAGSYEDPGRFETETGLQGGYPNFFNIRHNGAEIFSYGSRLYSPDESILEDLIISAAIGDTITLDAAVWAHVFGTAEDEDGGFGFDSEVDFFADIGVEPSPVPVPASLWLLGSGIIGIPGSGRIRLLRS